MIRSIRRYQTLIFDCDGVVLDSNKIKTDAFYQSVAFCGELPARELVRYHVSNGGISRYKKFDYFLNSIAPKYGIKNQDVSLDKLLKSYSRNVLEGLLTCRYSPGLYDFRAQAPFSRWLIVSGGDQKELRHVFKKRNLDEYFNGGIFGSPDSKNIIMKRELSNKNIQHPALFLGDSKYDQQVAVENDCDFAFISGWSEVENWPEWVLENNIDHFASLPSLLEKHS